MPPRTRRFVVVGLLATACGGAAPAEQPGRNSPPPPRTVTAFPPAPAPQPSPTPTASVTAPPIVDPRDVELPGAVWPPPGYEPPPCELELSTTARRRGPSYDVVAYVKNLSKRSITLELSDRCPQGPAAFYGLPGSRDYHQSCMKGACAEQRILRFSVAAGQRVQIDAVIIDAAGGSCNPPLPAGRHHVAFTIPYGGATCPGSWAAVGQPVKQPPAPPLPKTAPDPGVKCAEMPICGLACPGGDFARDERGCLLCACEERRGTLPGAPLRRDVR